MNQLLAVTDFERLRRVISLDELARVTGVPVEDLRRARDQQGLPVHNVLGTELVVRGELHQWASTP